MLPLSETDFDRPEMFESSWTMFENPESVATCNQYLSARAAVFQLRVTGTATPWAPLAGLLRDTAAGLLTQASL